LKTKESLDASHRIALILSGTGCLTCIIITAVIGSSLASLQNIWLLPGAYFLEITIGAMAGFLAVLTRHPGASKVLWIYCGTLLVFILMASFSVGFFFIPVLVIFGVVSILLDLKQKKLLPAHLGLFFCGLILQLVLMLAILWLNPHS
jgi:hypothetical protein